MFVKTVSSYLEANKLYEFHLQSILCKIEK